jgi:hypothetical protein
MTLGDDSSVKEAQSNNFDRSAFPTSPQQLLKPAYIRLNTAHSERNVTQDLPNVIPDVDGA